MHMTPPEEGSIPWNCMLQPLAELQMSLLTIEFNSYQRIGIWFGEVTPSLHNSRILFFLDYVKRF